MALETFIKEKRKVKLKNPILVGGFPGLGYVGKISVTYLMKKLKAKKLADLYSPYFPHHLLVSSSGRIRLPRAEFRFWRNPRFDGNDLILLSSDSQAKGFEGQYSVVNSVLEYADRMGVKKVVTLGGYRGNSGSKEPKVVSISSSRSILNKMLEAGAEPSPAGNPVVGFAGLALALSKFMEIGGVCLLVETAGYMPDPKASKAVLKVLSRFLGIALDLSSLDREIERSIKEAERMKEIVKGIEAITKELAEIEGREIKYIS